ncbi:MAG: hypothetical protein VW405_22445, partial [Rhodospirillaceae bacterium]
MTDDSNAYPPDVERARRLHEAGAYAALLGEHPRIAKFWRRIAADALANGDIGAAVELLNRTVERAPDD